MTKEIMMSLGRVVYVRYGEYKEKLGVVVDIINSNKVIISNPAQGVKRNVISNKRLELTKFKLSDITPSVKETQLKKQIADFDLQKKFDNTSFGKKII